MADSRRSAWYQWSLVLLVLGTIAFGVWGHWRYERQEHPDRAPDPYGILYHSSQLLIANGAPLEGAVPWQLHLARLLGLLALFTAGLLAFVKFFRDEAAMFRLQVPWRREHLVVCGLGGLGARLAMDARRRGRFVVAIEEHGESGAIEHARKSGVVVIEGNACDAAVLHRARVERAEFVLAASRDDSANVAVAATIGRTIAASPYRGRPLVCRLLIQDPELRRLLESESALGGRSGQRAATAPAKYRVNFRDLNLQDTAARQVLRRHPLDYQPIRQADETTVHLVVAGFGPMGQSLALQAARIGHFANCLSQDRRIRITIVDGDASRIGKSFRARYPTIDRVCEFACQDADPAAQSILEALDQLGRDGQKQNEMVTYAMCFEQGPSANDHENLRLGMELSGRTQGRPAQLLLYQRTRNGFAALFPSDWRGASAGVRLHAFGMHEEIYTWDVLMRESEDLLARALHEDYVQHRLRTGESANQPSWDELPEALRDSNRHAADHIPSKLRALGYHDLPVEPGRPRVETFDQGEALLLSQMEHQRWCAERWLDGWEYGPTTIHAERINKNLVPWDKLATEEQSKDTEQVQAIPRVLYAVGRGIYR